MKVSLKNGGVLRSQEWGAFGHLKRGAQWRGPCIIADGLGKSGGVEERRP